jgi:hypothetical protein
MPVLGIKIDAGDVNQTLVFGFFEAAGTNTHKTGGCK